MEYIILEDTSRKGLINQVNHYLGLGFHVAGGICVIYIEGHTIFLQSLIKYGPRKRRTRYQ